MDVEQQGDAESNDRLQGDHHTDAECHGSWAPTAPEFRWSTQAQRDEDDGERVVHADLQSVDVEWDDPGNTGSEQQTERARDDGGRHGKIAADHQPDAQQRRQGDERDHEAVLPELHGVLPGRRCIGVSSLPPCVGRGAVSPIFER